MMVFPCRQSAVFHRGTSCTPFPTDSQLCFTGSVPVLPSQKTVVCVSQGQFRYSLPKRQSSVFHRVSSLTDSCISQGQFQSSLTNRQSAVFHKVFVQDSSHYSPYNNAITALLADVKLMFHNNAMLFFFLL